MHRFGLILSVTKQQYEQKYAGTVGGYLWAIAHPLSTVFVFYFVFAYGLRVAGPEGTTFIAWFIAGLVPWFLFQEAVMSGVNSVIGNSHLVTKVSFPKEILPLASVLSAFWFNIYFWLLLFMLLIYLGVSFSIGKAFFLIFLAAELFLIVGIVYLVSALRVFLKDTAEMVGIIINVWFWATPIVWEKSLVPDQFRFVLDFNPMFYVTDGVRESLIFANFTSSRIWSDHVIMFLILALIAFFSFRFFCRLKEQFAEEL